MNKWEQRDKKRDKKRGKSFPYQKETVHKDKDKPNKSEIKQARRDKEAVWDTLEMEGDDE
jgi:hypothetical protein|tara:strand:+ start:785 stop:964 length:180 start_codon:yes stop_codon:yes gene_type:complete